MRIVWGWDIVRAYRTEVEHVSVDLCEMSDIPDGSHGIGTGDGILTFPDIRWRWEGTEVRCIRTVQRGQCRGRAQQPIFVFVNLGISYEKRFRVRRTRIDGARFLSLTADRPSIYRVGILRYDVLIRARS